MNDFINRRKQEIAAINKMGEDRMAICTACEHFKPDLSRCGKCGCFMKAKTRIPGASCPIGKWSSNK